MTALIDTNVILDLLLERKPFFPAAKSVITSIENETCRGAICATTVTDIYYIARRQIGDQRAKNCIQILTQLMQVAEVNASTVRGALSSEMRDFEDSIIHEAGLQFRVDCIVTRNVSDFSPGKLPVYTPDQFIPILAVLDRKN